MFLIFIKPFAILSTKKLIFMIFDDLGISENLEQQATRAVVT